MATTITNLPSDSQELVVPRLCTLAGFTEAAAQRKGLHVASLEPLTRIALRTRNTLYRLTVVSPNDWKVTVQGGRFFPHETKAFFCGSGYGGTLLKVAWIGIGMCCELSNEGQRVVTSPVRDFEILEDDLAGPF